MRGKRGLIFSLLILFFAVSAVIFCIQFTPNAQANNSACDRALKIRQEIAPGLRMLILADKLPPGEEKSKLMMQAIMSGAALRFYNDFCPALIECGQLPGYPQDAVNEIIKMCKCHQNKK